MTNLDDIYNLTDPYVPQPSALLSGHSLEYEGAPFDSKGRRDNHGGRGRCSCKQLSDVLPSKAARKRWHRDHKNQVRKELALSVIGREADAQRPTSEDAATLIFEALGAASTCWEDMSGTGVFQDQRASEIGQKLMVALGYELPAVGYAPVVV